MHITRNVGLSSLQLYTLRPKKILFTSLHALAVLRGAPPPFLPMTPLSRRVLRGAAAVSRSTAFVESGQRLAVILRVANGHRRRVAVLRRVLMGLIS